MKIIHNLGFPRIGAARELKRAQESYWAGKTGLDDLLATGRDLRARHWNIQARAGAQWVPVGDFAWYDHILEWTTLLGAVPARFAQAADDEVSLDTLFRMARGRAPSGTPAAACEMTKWFDTNYHYIVPELVPGQSYRIARSYLFDQIREAQGLGHQVKPVIPGPLTWLWLGKGDAFAQGAGDPAKLALLDTLVPVYVQVLEQIQALGVEWVQVDEPILGLDLPEAWQRAFQPVYEALAKGGPRLLLATYFEDLKENVQLLKGLPVDGVHVDLVRAPDQLARVLAVLGDNQVLSAGLINGRNVWRSDLDKAGEQIRQVAQQLGDRLWLAPSCSLLHVPVDLDAEGELDAELRGWLSFAVQKLDELNVLAESLAGTINPGIEQALQRQRTALLNRKSSSRIHNPAVQQRLKASASVT